MQVSDEVPSGQLVVIQSFPIGQSVLKIDISGAQGSTGVYTLKAMLNALAETEGLDGSNNGGPSTAQSLDDGFVSLGSKGNVLRSALLGTLREQAELAVYADSFEQGRLGESWTTRSSEPSGRIQLTGSAGASDKTNALWMDSRSPGTTVLNEAVWTLDLSKHRDLTLRFSHAEVRDEETGFEMSYTDRFDADGISISMDGKVWHPIWSAPHQPFGAWKAYALHLDTFAQRAGISLTDTFRIKFQQIDDFPIDRDGRGWDDLKITTPELHEDWYRMTLADGDKISVVLVSLSQKPVHLELYGTDGPDPVALGREAKNVDRWLAYDVSMGGDYFVRVCGSGPYSLTSIKNGSFEREPNGLVEESLQELSSPGVVLGALSIGESRSIRSEKEPNDNGNPGVQEEDLFLSNDWVGSFVQVEPNQYRALLTGEIGLSHDRDWDFFRIFASPGDQLLLTLKSDTQGDTLLRLLDQEGTQIAFDDDGGRELNARLRYDSFTYAGFYYVVADLFSSGTSTYRLEARLTTQEPLPRDDNYGIELSPEQRVRVTTSTPGDGPFAFVNNLDPRLTILDPQNSVVTTSQDVADDGRNASVSFQPDVQGLYRINVSSEHNTVGEYLLEVTVD